MRRGCPRRARSRGEQPADFHHQQPGIEVVGRRLRGQADQLGVRLDDRRESRAAACRAFAPAITARASSSAASWRSRSGRAPIASASPPRSSKPRIALARRSRASARASAPRSSSTKSSAAPGEPPAAAIAAARVARVGLAAPRAARIASISPSSSGGKRSTRQRERIVGSSRAEPVRDEQEEGARPAAPRGS